MHWRDANDVRFILELSRNAAPASWSRPQQALCVNKRTIENNPAQRDSSETR
jgi:hypothetical protein